MLSILIDPEVTLRSYTPEDAPALFRAIQKNRTHLRPWLAWIDGTTKEEHSRAFIEDALTQQHHQQGIAAGIFRNEEVIGGVGMLHWNHQLQKAQIGYWIDKQYEGTGLLSRCLEKFIDYLFETVNLNKIEIHFVASNERSAAIARRFNAKLEGILRDSCVVNGNLSDLVVTGLLKKEWREFQASSNKSGN